MALDVKYLFKIVGEEGPALRRVEEAMAWLLSPKAEGIGEQLLRDAHALHGKPVTINASTRAVSAYYNSAAEHTVVINPEQVEQMLIPTTDGAHHAMSVECCLGHELTHAGQPRVIEGFLEKAQLELELADTLHAHPAPEELVHIEHALNAIDYTSARQHLGTYIDAMMPKQVRLNEMLMQHPGYHKFVQEFEEPAMAVERKIAALRGEPVRAHYTKESDIDPAVARRIMLDEMSHAMGLHEKLEASAFTTRNDGELWADSLGEMTGFTRKK